MATNNIVLKGNYNSAVVINKPLSANGESVALAAGTNVYRAGSTALNTSYALGPDTVASGDYSIATGHGTKATGNYSRADGVNAAASHDYSYVWSGTATADGTNSGTSKGEGTYNVWTKDGVKGYYISGVPLETTIVNTVAENVAVLGANNKFTGSNTFNGLALSGGSTANLAGGTTIVSDIDEDDGDGAATNKKYVENRLSSLSGEIMAEVKAATGTVYTKEEVEKLIEDYLKAVLGDGVIAKDESESGVETTDGGEA